MSVQAELKLKVNVLTEFFKFKVLSSRKCYCFFVTIREGGGGEEMTDYSWSTLIDNRNFYFIKASTTLNVYITE